MERDRSGLTRRHVLMTGAALATAPIVGGSLSAPARAAAAMLGLSQPAHCRFKLGAFELTTILDSNAFVDGPWPLIGTNASQDEVDRLMRDNLLPTHKYQPGFTPLVVNTGKDLILFDTGNGANGYVSRPQGGWLAAQLGPAGFKPEQIDLVVISHGHPDHIGGLMEEGKPFFPNARYVISDVEYGFWSAKDKHSGDMEKFASLFRANVVTLADKISFLKPGADVAPGIRAVEAYGHTPGHLAFHIESDGSQLLFWGDCAHHQVASLARPDWQCVFDVDQEKGSATRKRIFDMTATDRIAVSGYHIPFPSIGYVERLDATGYRWVPHSYQLNL